MTAFRSSRKAPPAPSVVERSKSGMSPGRRMTEKYIRSRCPPSYQTVHDRGSSPVRNSVPLPTEIVLEIVSYIEDSPHSQGTLYNICLVSQQWYSVAIARLYRRPYLYGANYDAFVRTICPSINAHVRESPLAGFVRELDLSHLVHHGSRTITARLLGRTKQSLEVFIAPQASFAVNSFAALSKCKKLRVLNLSLVSEAIPFDSLAHVLRNLDRLRELTFPRCASEDNASFLSDTIRWPRMLEKLTLSGGVQDSFMWGLYRAPETLPPSVHDLTLAHLPKLNNTFTLPFLERISNQLTTLRVYSVPHVPPGAFDEILGVCTHLRYLAISVDYITSFFAEPPHDFATGKLSAHPLTELELLTDGSPQAAEGEALSPLDLEVAMEKGWLRRLRRLQVTKALGWHSEPELRQELEDLEQRMREEHAADLEELGRHGGPSTDVPSRDDGSRLSALTAPAVLICKSPT